MIVLFDGKPFQHLQARPDLPHLAIVLGRHCLGQDRAAGGPIEGGFEDPVQLLAQRPDDEQALVDRDREHRPERRDEHDKCVFAHFNRPFSMNYRSRSSSIWRVSVSSFSTAIRSSTWMRFFNSVTSSRR